MSLGFEPIESREDSFPRVSGDEPVGRLESRRVA